MTGEKDRYTTTEKLWSLDDKTLRTPAHDEMVLWLLNKDHICSIFPGTSDFLNDTYPRAHLKYNSDLNKNWNNMWWNLLEDNTLSKSVGAEYEYLQEEYNIGKHLLKSKPNDLDILSEVPITAENGFLVGYSDIVLQSKTPVFITDNLVHYKGKEQPTSKGLVICNERVHNTNVIHKVCLDRYYIEVKPVIRSFGETLRQLNTYKHYLHASKLYLFTTDLRFKDAFESQGIEVLTYPSN